MTIPTKAKATKPVKKQKGKGKTLSKKKPSVEFSSDEEYFVSPSASDEVKVKVLPSRQSKRTALTKIANSSTMVDVSHESDDKENSTTDSSSNFMDVIPDTQEVSSQSSDAKTQILVTSKEIQMGNKETSSSSYVVSDSADESGPDVSTGKQYSTGPDSPSIIPDSDESDASPIVDQKTKTEKPLQGSQPTGSQSLFDGSDHCTSANSHSYSTCYNSTKIIPKVPNNKKVVKKSKKAAALCVEFSASDEDQNSTEPLINGSSKGDSVDKPECQRVNELANRFSNMLSKNKVQHRLKQNTTSSKVLRPKQIRKDVQQGKSSVPKKESGKKILRTRPSNSSRKAATAGFTSSDEDVSVNEDIKSQRVLNSTRLPNAPDTRIHRVLDISAIPRCNETNKSKKASLESKRQILCPINCSVILERIDVNFKQALHSDLQDNNGKEINITKSPVNEEIQHEPSVERQNVFDNMYAMLESQANDNAIDDLQEEDTSPDIVETNNFSLQCSMADSQTDVVTKSVSLQCSMVTSVNSVTTDQDEAEMSDATVDYSHYEDDRGNDSWSEDDKKAGVGCSERQAQEQSSKHELPGVVAETNNISLQVSMTQSQGSDLQDDISQDCAVKDESKQASNSPVNSSQASQASPSMYNNSLQVSLPSPDKSVESLPTRTVPYIYLSPDVTDDMSPMQRSPIIKLDVQFANLARSPRVQSDVSFASPDTSCAERYTPMNNISIQASLPSQPEKSLNEPALNLSSGMASSPSVNTDASFQSAETTFDKKQDSQDSFSTWRKTASPSPTPVPSKTYDGSDTESEEFQSCDENMSDESTGSKNGGHDKSNKKQQLLHVDLADDESFPGKSHDQDSNGYE